jgi:hypothetical protein
MADKPKIDEKDKRYFEIANRLRNGDDTVSYEDMKFFYSHSPVIDDTKVQKLVEGGVFASADDARNAVLEASKAIRISPQYKDQTLKIAQEAERGRVSNTLSQGIGLVLAGSDIAQSVAQIVQSRSDLSRSRKPSRPAVPARDQALSEALRRSQEGTSDAGRATEAAKAEIRDQYNQDITNARIASTGQAGAFGSYAQLAADRRNKSSAQLAPIQDQIRREEQGRQDNLIQTRMGETQRQFENQASLYPTDLYQYQIEQQAAAALGSQGRSNLRNSLYNFGSQAGPAFADYYTQRKYTDLRNRASAAGLPADVVVNSQQALENRWSPRQGPPIADYWMDNPINRGPNRVRYRPNIE